MKKSTLAATAAALLAASGAAFYAVIPAQAQSRPDPMGDGTVTWEQAKVRADELWTRMDVNKDGVLNAADREAKMAQMFDAIDTNHDGAISRAEFMTHHKMMMDREGMDHRRGMMGGNAMEGPPHGGEMTGMGPGGPKMHEMAAMADTNHDDAISRAEFDAAAKARFDKGDANHDGQLTAAERRAGWAGMRKGHGGWRGGRGHGMGADMGDMPPPPPPGE